MENMGLANVCHEFYSFPSNLLKSAVSGTNSMDSWKILPWRMFSIICSLRFMECSGPTNIFHEFVAFKGSADTLLPKPQLLKNSRPF